MFFAKPRRCAISRALLIVGITTPLAKAESNQPPRWEVEAGVVKTRQFEISGYKQGNATNGWQSTDPDLRIEYWKRQKEGWNFGGVLQPLYVKYNDQVKSDLNCKGKTFSAGESAKLTYQFHSMRGSANYPVFLSSSGSSEIRAGSSLIVRYAQLDFRGENDSFHDTNLIAFPLLNLETTTVISDDLTLVSRSDFLPSPDQNFFLDGLFDVMLGVRFRQESGSAIDLGARLFFGGYDPKSPDDYANRIFYQAAVVRYLW